MKRVVTLEVIYPHPPERVWRALTNPEELARWLMPNDFEPRLGHKVSFFQESRRSGAGVIECEVIELERPLRLSYTWRDPSDASRSIVTWTLTPVARGTCLRLEHQDSPALVPGDWTAGLNRLKMLLGATAHAAGTSTPEAHAASVESERRRQVALTPGLIRTIPGWAVHSPCASRATVPLNGGG